MVSPDQAKACGQFQDFGLLEQWKKWKDFKQESSLLRMLFLKDNSSCALGRGLGRGSKTNQEANSRYQMVKLGFG